MKMVELQTKTAKQRQSLENKAKFKRSVYTCARNIAPDMMVSSRAASLIEQDGNDFVEGLVSKAMEFALSSHTKKLEAAHLLSALSSNPEYLIKITPHPTAVSLS